ncbi:MAG: ASKHA domain-containing protein [Bryobacteraceae bacterium]
MAEYVRLKPEPGRTLSDQLYQLGLEFPCGGCSSCGGCRVRLVDGEIAITEGMREALREDELSAGWRLACQADAGVPVTLDIEQWSARILTDDTRVAFEPAEGFGAVMDVGTTTLVVELVDLATGDIRGVLAGLNPQGRHGSDVMSRIEFDLREPGVLSGHIRGTLGAMLAEVAQGRKVKEVLLCGNTAMHHLFCGESVEPLSHVPFSSPSLGARTFAGRELGWKADAVTFLPCPGGFVGSDLLAGLVACGMAESAEVMALMDLGTNGEIALGNRDGILCASTAAGPAFEGGRIRMGMRAGDGAIDRVEATAEGGLRCHVLGGGEARGICGSGLVDAAAVGLELGMIAASGRLSNAPLRLDGAVLLSQADIRELQLAKGAIAAGLEILRQRRNVEPADVKTIHLAGAFGNYVRVESARRIGLLPGWKAQVVPVGNSAVRGARLLLLNPSRREAMIEAALSRTRHVDLGGDAEFQEAFVENMRFTPPGR